ncbi:glucan endo-1,3-beta-glucosidase 12 isoform X1 [Selaginella moellendorffii]|uniref:glucan endo-1,3-beta-glucosidase 12 isoform X1 n=1 Tax=Selaginella moellendorffii TaxID=88036 RepID=UPI000D1D0C87|nr:glucan endo-1,3-beta-glucosidase 12 isoform X1 [Selaginella moellendorffii]|eukprot:XP_024522730.1 glucan endo-1,3-beta-glucosidase 12 isoform X1 [Selaginella moellendorffii]
MDLWFWLVFIMIVAPTVPGSAAGTVGVNYGRLASKLPSPGEVVELVRSLGVTKVKIYDTDATVLQAFANTSIELTVSVPNNDIPALATNISTGQNWVNSSILLFYPQTKITTILVGYEVLTAGQHITPYLLTAMENIHSAVATLKIDSQVKVSTTHSLNILNMTSPPSLCSFDHEAIVRPLLQFLSKTGAPFMVNIYTFSTFQQDKGRNFPESFALLKPTGFVVVDPISRLRYENLFLAQLDAVYSAIDNFGFSDIQVAVSETGWPFTGKSGASVRKSRSYNQHVARLCLSGAGTPLVRDRPIEVFIHSLFNEDLQPSSLGTFGLYFTNKSRVFDFDTRTLQPSK